MFTKYFELGLALIPVKRGNKNPIINGWQQYCKTKPTVEQLTYWENHHRGCNYGLPLGPANGLVALDIDTDNPITLKMCPQSPLVKRGAKGETRFFRYHSKVRTTKLFQKSKGVEILSDGTQTIIPPSVHPDTKKPYFWLSKDTLENFDINDLPILDPTFLHTLPRIDGRDKITKEIYQGRNDKLKAMAVAALNNFKGIEEVARELLEFDQEYHSPPLFSDIKEPSNKSKNPYDNALRFVRSVHKTVESSLKTLPVIELTESDEKEEVSTLKPLPEPTGLLKDIMDNVAFNSYVNQPQFALCTALSIFSTLCSGRFKFDNTHPNLFSIAMGSRGTGKDDIVKQAQNYFNHPSLFEYNLYGHGKYASAQALVKNLPSQRARLDVFDEFSTLLVDASKKDGRAYSIVSTLNELYSSSGRMFNGVGIAISRPDSGKVVSPFVNLIGLVQPSMFINKSTSDFFDNGFYSRVLFFMADKEAKLNTDLVDRDENTIRNGIDSVVENLIKIFPNKNILQQDSKYNSTTISLNPDMVSMFKVAPENLKADKNVRNRIKDIMSHYDDVRRKSSDGSIEENLSVRAAELVLKIAINAAVSEDQRSILAKYLDFGMALVDTLTSNAASVLEKASGPKGQALLTSQIEDYIKEKKVVISDRIHSCFGKRGHSTSFRREALKDLVERGSIEACEITYKNKKKTGYKYISELSGQFHDIPLDGMQKNKTKSGA